MNGHIGNLFRYFLYWAIGSFVVLLLPELIGWSWMPESITPEGDRIDDLFIGMMILSIFIFSLVAAVIWYSIRNFKAEPGDESDGEPIHGNHKLEVVWTIIPAVIVTILSVISYVTYAENEKTPSRSVAINVQAFSFGWKFSYPGHDVSQATNLVLPKGTTAMFSIISCSGKEGLARSSRVLSSLAQTKDEHHSEEAHEIAKERAEREASAKPLLCERQHPLPDQMLATFAVDKLRQLELSDEDRVIVMEEFTELMKIRDEEFASEVVKQADEADKQKKEIKQKTRQEDFADVTHAFWVPEARLKVDAVPGLRTRVQWTPEKLTLPSAPLQVVCAELCGSGHAGMRVDICVVDEDTTMKWWFKNPDTPCSTLEYFNCYPAKKLASADLSDLRKQVETVLADDEDATCATMKKEVTV